MIYDQLIHLSRYKNSHPRLAIAIDYWLHQDLSQLKPGRYAIQGDEIFLIYQENTLSKATEVELEYHKKYADLHILLVGDETIGYSQKFDWLVKDYDAVADFGLVASNETVDLRLTPENFVLFFPGEYHQPNQLGKAGTRVRKCVLKILMD